MKSKVYVKFPKTGLGNLMLVWARACVFAHINNLPMVTSPWWAFRWGAWLRNENRKRLYFGYFRESSLVERWIISVNRRSIQVIQEPVITKLLPSESAYKIYQFSKVITDNDLFETIRDHRTLLKKEIFSLLRPELLSALNRYQVPVIAIHIRRGDFKLGNPITPLSFFTDCIQNIRLVAKEDLPVTIFTDAHPDEISEILSLPNTSLSVPKADILDILLMSKSKFIVLSQSSTFSYWSAFLSDAIILKPAQDWQHQLRNDEINSRIPEIRWKEADPISVEQLTRALSVERV